ncbi:hypothetical protein AB0H73_09555 [Streptomyces olivoreticuli]
MRWWKRPRNACTAVADDLVVPYPFELETFCQSIGQQRGRPLLLLPLDGPPDPDMPCGIWIGLDAADLVFYEATASDFLRVQIVLHEISHMLLGHTAPEFEVAEDASEKELAAASAHFQKLLDRTTASVSGHETPELPLAEIMRAEAARVRAAAAARKSIDDELGLSTDRLLALMGRSKYGSRQERDAETLATLILARASRTEARSSSDSSEAADRLARLHDALGRPNTRS